MSNITTLDDILSPKDPRMKHINLFLNITDYESFLEALYYAIEKIVMVNLEKSKSNLPKDENHISDIIVGQLYGLNYDASREESSNGNVDVTVKFAEFIWLAEAKIFNSNPYLLEGFKQLASRYSTASNLEANKGAYLIYNFRANTKELIDSYKAYSLAQLPPDFPDYQVKDCPVHPLRFFSTHTEAGSGLEYQIKHIPFTFYFDPVDKSGITSKPGRDKKNTGSSN
jgi:hypothetical protein